MANSCLSHQSGRMRGVGEVRAAPDRLYFEKPPTDRPLAPASVIKTDAERKVLSIFQRAAKEKLFFESAWNIKSKLEHTEITVLCSNIYVSILLSMP